MSTFTIHVIYLIAAGECGQSFSSHLKIHSAIILLGILPDTLWAVVHTWNINLTLPSVKDMFFFKLLANTSGNSLNNTPCTVLTIFPWFIKHLRVRNRFIGISDDCHKPFNSVLLRFSVSPKSEHQIKFVNYAWQNIMFWFNHVMNMSILWKRWKLLIPSQ